MKTLPAIGSADTTRKFTAPGYRAELLDNLVCSGMVQYRCLFVVFNERSGEKLPCFVVSSEIVTALNTDVLGIFDPTGHTTLRETAGNWNDRDVFVKKAIEIVANRLGVSFPNT